jgi:P-type Ca2+ transporter type 2C
LVRELGTDADRGLEEPEALRNLERDGPNRLPERAGPSRLAMLGRQLASPLVALLAGAAAVSFAIGEQLDAAIIVAIVVANSVLGYVQEGRAEQAARRLHSLLAPTARVIRDGRPAERDAEQLVVGDVVILRAGDRVPADGRLLRATRLEVDESALTGESLPVAKRAEPAASADAPIAERPTAAFAGTVVTRGSGRAVVTATGAETEIGCTVAAAIRLRPPQTPLQARLNRFSGFVLRAAGVLCLALAALAWLHGDSLSDSFLIGVSLAVAAVPEGLPAVITIALAIGVQRMAKHAAIVRRLAAVETLGSTTVICTDKTGTLTENRLAVTRLYVCESRAELEPDIGTSEVVDQLVGGALLASQDDAGAVVDGGALPADPIEAAIAVAAQDRGLSGGGVLEGRRVASVEPFDSDRKRMSVVLEGDDGGRTSYVKGAPEAVIPRLADGSRPVLSEVSRRWAETGQRVLLIARRELPRGGDPESSLLALGLLAFEDPPRASARASVEQARGAGVRTVMITGDHPGTALAIARATGIGSAGHEAGALTGPELDRLSDAELLVRSREVDVYARVAPEHKVRIVDALTRDGQVVAMTGDGVNDVPALEAAHIGVAMGRRGTDAAKAAADMVLADDDYSTIVRAIRRGRSIYDNLLRFVQFLLAANAGEVIVFALAIALGLSAPLTVVQILLVNLLTDGLPAVALGVDPPERGVMRRPPRPPEEGLLDPIRDRLLVGGLATGGAAFASFLIGEGSGHPLGQTMAFTTLVFAQLVYVFAVRGSGWFFAAGRNLALYGAVALSAAIQIAILAVPSVAGRSDVVSMSPGHLAAALGLAAVPFVCLEALKAVRRQMAIRGRVP